MIADRHPWLLLAPWYRWPAQGVPTVQRGRDTRPVIQKYAGTDFVDRFLAEPQRSLTFDAGDHWQYLAALPALSPLGGRRRRLCDDRLVTTPTRKLFLPVHDRFYLIVVALHCDLAGLPVVDPRRVHRAGFVVRRRSATRSDGAALPADVVQRLATARTAVREVALDGLLEQPDELAVLAGPAWSAFHTERLDAARELLDAQEALASWAASNEVTFGLEGWVPDPDHEGVGSWQPVEEEPEHVDEVVHDLRPLVPPPAVPDHDGVGAGLWFGMVPTGGRELTDGGEPRFDDDHVYEIRCFAERDDRCHEVTWSRPSERYLLAPPLDLDGTGNRPVTVKLPDVRRLAAQIPAKGGVRFASPPGSPRFTATGTNATSIGPSTAVEICSFAIPLITIVAFFVFSLFLGVVLLVFNLWWMLALKFCIPPSVQMGAGLEAELAALPPGADIDVDVSASVRGAIDAQLHADLAAAFGASAADAMRTTYSPQALLDLHEQLRVDRSAPSSAPSLVADLRYEPTVERSAVVVA